LDIPYNRTGGADTPGATGIRGFRIHGTVKAARIADQAAAAVHQAMAVVEQRFRTDSCTVGGFIASALAADVRNFDKVNFPRCVFHCADWLPCI
jgi:hypothetical protein